MASTTTYTSRAFYHPDIWVFLIAIPFISAFNYYLTYSNIQFNSFLLTRFTIDTLQGYVAWLLVRWVIFSLDQKIPYKPDFLRRIVIQMITTMIVGLGFLALSTELLSVLIKGETAPIHFYTKDLVIISIWFFVINGFYVGMFFYRQWESAETEKQSLKPEMEGFPVRTGNQLLLIKFSEIDLFLVEEDYVQLIASTGKNYLLDLSLDKIEQKLSPIDFFRVNRQFIVSRQIVTGFKRLENGKLLVQVNCDIKSPQELTVSRTKAPAFKSWFLPQG
ncbi:LytR/AlgR family response regulator transcription factor [Aquiflexum gelatinilyticum]|uniref:LytR/AlgR family response regulator transcription factor n=1 Tax=Aquiflexum gelatinilyticum TaxID=2961943 RepID=UPI002167A4D0|nr:LytTR family DNA-binding domain-containing protein [Aquiflexum gelatinilyticum]MCS4436853.1 LytTR family transcriptional regulator [Aquiflexum gelatinilyticum]